MKPLATTIVVGIYLHGCELQPDAITRRLGVGPTRAQVAGGVRYGSRTARAKLGMWALLAQSTSHCVSDHIDELLGAIDNCSVPLSELPGVDQACLDVFMSTDESNRPREPLELIVSVDHLAVIRKLGLFLRVTVAY